ncbi:hypothetical protein TraAM80_07476 [Trypanosoma rangeli]|uniref:Uncharacterized protein n=1 Tax=Trypanosoma rangeli TaxID=5698 RepID=A0A3R7MDN0_TRYRA|nr:uncharacterized protein TraAM80_07476 [Trypanosoma rangeli]RNF00658.1 hypothetical protein TraAM80_07476 [Trypanosoma rangeli]|eukprot:RNF00658.1 hypothetical protein TraAM80_07476 [Trypanosoma rangeli]
MSGCGRKHRAKHLTRQFLDADGWSGPAPGESMAVCVESPQSQHVRVLLFNSDGAASNNGDVDDNGAVLPAECVVFVPGKFRKVIWLAVKDVIVVADGTTVAFKPSPDQLKTFFRENPEWKRRLSAAQEMVETCRRTVEQMPQYVKTTHTTTSMLAKVAEEGSAGASADVVEGGEDEETGDLNPNRNNIRHKAQFFYDSEGEEDEEEEDEEEEEG